MSLPLHISGRLPILNLAAGQPRTGRRIRFDKPLITALALNLVLWGGLITGVHALIS